jgi:hypothetical protein
MDEQLRQKILDEAIRIGDELLDLAEHDKKSMSWKTMSMDLSKSPTEDGFIVWRKSESIYAGVAGIVLFLAELYKQTKDDKYLNAAIEGMRWIESYCANFATDYYAFLAGRMSVPYVMLKMFELTQDCRYIEKALKVAEPCADFLRSSRVVNDLINGTSGTLLALMHLHAMTGENRLLEKIDLFLNHLIESAHRGPQGLYWDNSPKKIHGLCGFSHGAAGVGFVFLEAARYLGRESLYHVAEEAFLYETYHFDKTKRNWPDFRKGIWTSEDLEAHKKAYWESDMSFFTTPRYMNAWCHGAPGIGLSRLRAFELLKDKKYAEAARVAIQTTREYDNELDINPKTATARSCTLCHGSAGNAELFLEAYNIFGNEEYWLFAEEVALQALAHRDMNHGYISGYGRAGTTSDLSLFIGNAGLGYFYLRLLAPREIPSILAPKILANAPRHNGMPGHSTINISLPSIRKKLAQKLFRRTIFVVEKLLPDMVSNYFEQPASSDAVAGETFSAFLDELFLPMLAPKEREIVSDAFALELEKWKLDQAISSNAFLNIKAILHAEEARQLIERQAENFHTLELALEAEAKIISTGWNWTSSQETDWLINLSSEAGMYAVLLKTDPENRVVEKGLSTFSYAVLSCFSEKTCVENALQKVIASFEVVSDEDEAAIRKAATEQIKEAILGGILTLSQQM